MARDLYDGRTYLRPDGTLQQGEKRRRKKKWMAEKRAERAMLKDGIDMEALAEALYSLLLDVTSREEEGEGESESKVGSVDKQAPTGAVIPTPTSAPTSVSTTVSTTASTTASTKDAEQSGSHEEGRAEIGEAKQEEEEGLGREGEIEHQASSSTSNNLEVAGEMAKKREEGGGEMRADVVESKAGEEARTRRERKEEKEEKDEEIGEGRVRRGGEKEDENKEEDKKDKVEEVEEEVLMEIGPVASSSIDTVHKLVRHFGFQYDDEKQGKNMFVLVSNSDRDYNEGMVKSVVTKWRKSMKLDPTAPFHF